MLCDLMGKTYLVGKTNCICYTNNHRHRELEPYINVYHKWKHLELNVFCLGASTKFLLGFLSYEIKKELCPF